jgi:hypothetical protein
MHRDGTSYASARCRRKPSCWRCGMRTQCCAASLAGSAISRRAGPTWKQFLIARARSILAVDFVHVDTILLRRVHALIIIEHGTHCAHLAGITAGPDGAWTTQAARNFVMDAGNCAQSARFLIRGAPGSSRNLSTLSSRRRDPDSLQPAAGTEGERHLRADDRYPAPRASRPVADHQRAPPAPGTDRVPEPLQRRPPAPCAWPTTARSSGDSTTADQSRRALRPPKTSSRRPYQRVLHHRITPGHDPTAYSSPTASAGGAGRVRGSTITATVRTRVGSRNLRCTGPTMPSISPPGSSAGRSSAA